MLKEYPEEEECNFLDDAGNPTSLTHLARGPYPSAPSYSIGCSPTHNGGDQLLGTCSLRR